jgi:hypothetical protein
MPPAAGRPIGLERRELRGVVDEVADPEDYEDAAGEQTEAR